jgi:hypothetical protein
VDGAVWNNGSNKSFHRLVQFSKLFDNENGLYYILYIVNVGAWIA